MICDISPVNGKAFTNYFGHNIILTYMHGKNISQYSAGMHHSGRATDRIYEVANNPDMIIVGLSCPTEFLEEMQYSHPDILDIINAAIPGMV